MGPIGSRLPVNAWILVPLWLGAGRQAPGGNTSPEVRSGAPESPASRPVPASERAGLEEIHGGGVAGRESPTASEDAALASLWKRSRIEASRSMASERNLTATLRPRRLSSASNTTPMPPEPSLRRIL